MKDISLYGITRVDNVVTGQHGWYVAIERKRDKRQKFFSDVHYGGQRRALRVARAFRDELAAVPLMSKKDYVSIKRSNNNSGVAGVCRVVDVDRKGDRVEYWLAFWPKTEGGRRTAKFSVAKYGEDEAFQRAVQARQDGISSLLGPHVNAEIQKRWIDPKEMDPSSDPDA